MDVAMTHSSMVATIPEPFDLTSTLVRSLSFAKITFLLMSMHFQKYELVHSYLIRWIEFPWVPMNILNLMIQPYRHKSTWLFSLWTWVGWASILQFSSHFDTTTYWQIWHLEILPLRHFAIQTIYHLYMMPPRHVVTPLKTSQLFSSRLYVILVFLFFF